MNNAGIAVWAAGLLLDLLLLIIVFRNGIARRFPLFTTLITFYILRGVGLYLLFGSLSAKSYNGLVDTLSFADIALQVLVAGEIALHIVRRREQASRGRAALIAGAITIALAIGAAVAGASRPNMDRGVLFIALLMVFLTLWMTIAHLHGLARRVAGGFAVFGLICIAADLLRRFASLHRREPLWIGATWAKSGAWIAIVLFWIFALAPGSGWSFLKSAKYRAA